MTYLIDTDILYEICKGEQCDIAVSAWYASISGRELFLSALSLGEIRKGAERVRFYDPRQAELLNRWLLDVELAFDGRLLGIDKSVSEQWGRMNAIRKIPAIDALQAATALTHGLTLVTSRDSNVLGLGVKVLNPFRGSVTPLTRDIRRFGT